MSGKTIGILGVCAIAAVAAAIWYLERPAAPVVVAPPVAHTPPPLAGEVERRAAAAPLPPPEVAAPATLEGSDAAARMAIADFAPQLLQWLTPPEQIRKWVALVDQLADGAVPVEQRPLAYPLQPFQIERRGDAIVADRANYERATALIDAFTAIPPARLVQYYRGWQPLLEKSYRELGRGGSFEQRLLLAVQRIEAVKPLPSQPELVQPGVYFQFADTGYENASELEKLMWRVGPENSRRLQEHLRAIEASMR